MSRPQPDVADGLDALTSAVERLHGATARFVGSTPVHEQFQGATVWQGSVSEFELHGHPRALRCYAWSVPAQGDQKQRFYAVLHTTEVDSPSKAVRASIVADQHNKTHR